MILRIFLYGLLLYLLYKYVVQPLFAGIRGQQNDDSKVHYKKRENIRNNDEGEYIDYEEIKENE